MSFKRMKVVMIATTERSGKISMGNSSGVLDYHVFVMEKGGIYNNHTYQHLYIISEDDEPKFGDYVLTPDGSILEIPKVFRPEGKKIIASTNTRMGLVYPSDSFIEKYVRAYNEKKPIEEVMVEYHKVGGVEKLKIKDWQIRIKKVPLGGLRSTDDIIRSIPDYWEGGKAQYTEEDVKEAMLDFATEHVQAALREVEQKYGIKGLLDIYPKDRIR